MIDYYTFTLCTAAIMFSYIVVCYTPIAKAKSWPIGRILSWDYHKNDYVILAAFFGGLSAIYYVRKVNEWWTIFPTFIIGCILGFIFIFFLKNHSQIISVVGVVLLFFLIPFEYNKNTQYQISLFNESHRLGIESVYDEMQISERVSNIEQALSFGLELDTLYLKKFPKGFRFNYENYFLTGIIKIKDSYVSNNLDKYQEGLTLIEKWKKWYGPNSNKFKELYLR